MITLYHGSNVVINDIDLSRSKKGKDFGTGFYLNADKHQAKAMAVRTTRILGTGEPVVNAYLFDESILAEDNELQIKIFDDYSAEWAQFILSNRANMSDNQIHDYDIVIGPIADDTVGVQISRYLLGYIDVEALVRELRFRGSRAVQYFFGTQRAVSLLKFDRYE